MSRLLENVLVEVVNADIALRALVGDRLYPITLPRTLSLAAGSKDLPALTYAMISRLHHAEIPVIHPRYRFMVFADSYESAKRVAQAVENCFTGCRRAGIRLSALAGAQDLHDLDAGIYRVPVDVKITYMEEV